MRIPIVLVVFVLIAHAVSHAQDKLSHEQRHQANVQYQKDLRANEITYSVEVWGFSRIYPLVDGLLQDIAATQVASMALNPNAPNGTSVDAVQQSLQMQLQFSQMAGVQNAAAAQAATSNSNYQSNLAQQETALMQDLVSAYGQVSTAQTNLNKLQASGTASTADLTTAQQALQGANSNLTAVGNAITNFKSLASPTVPSAATPLVSTPTLPGMSASVLPTGITGAATGSPNATPSFPPTKQLDNQINILWDRVARLVGAMSNPDSMSPDDQIYLVKFDTGIYPLNREGQLLDVTYSLSCEQAAPRHPPFVIDLFPRNAALNIVEDKYKDTSYGFGAVLSWFGVGGSVAYNREHLKATQLLGQSSYITGHGIGQTNFGWLFGKSLGDNSISPGPRNTFALVVATKGCSPRVKVASAAWSKPPKFNLRFPEPTAPTTSWPLENATNDCKDKCVTSIEFNRAEYDPTAGKPTPVTVRITLSKNMDQQQTVSVNGQFVQRVRDNFGRAVSPLTSGTNGVLETQQMGTNTWIPTSPTTMIVTLDSSQFGNQFPEILLNSPQGVIDVVHNQAKDSSITVSGNTLTCDTPSCAPPSLGVLKPANKNLGVTRWIATTGPGQKRIDKLCLTVLNPDISTVSTTAATSAVPTVQVISDTDNPEWGSDAEVDWINDGKLLRLPCDPPRGSRLVCDAPDWNTGKPFRPLIELQVHDQHHSGGTSIKGTVSTVRCNNDSNRTADSCRRPLLWKTSPPKLLPNPSTEVGTSQWKMWIQIVNVDDTDRPKLGTLDADVIDPATKHLLNCSKAPEEPCTASFTFPIAKIGAVSDWMSLALTDQNGEALGGHAVVTNVLANMRPLINQIQDDRTSWQGQNLVFENIRIGSSQTYKVDCLSDGSQCKGTGKYGASPGFMYFAANANLAFPFLQLAASGTPTAVTYTPPKPPAASVGGAAKPAAPTPTPAAPIENLNRLPMFKMEVIE